jgi:iron-sulfur cluster assembly protein
MITVTRDAATQIRTAADQAQAAGLALRIAARRDADGSIHYAMGFDETREQDLSVTCEGIELVVSPGETDLLAGLTLDFVEYERGDFRFIFINPNDVAPSEATKAQGCGSGGCGCAGGTTA